MIKILLIEDDLEISDLLTQYLSRYQMEVISYAHPKAALNSLAIESYDLVLLDLTLPDMDGLDVCKALRERSDIPIIISSARSDLGDKVIALELGADDYLPKPYEPRELIARIKSVLRRYRPSLEKKEKNFVLNEHEHEQTILKNGSPLTLTRAEYEILSLFLLHPNQTLSRDFLSNNSEAISWESSVRTIDVIISRLRQKIEKDPKNPRFIHSIRGSGYRFSG